METNQDRIDKANKLSEILKSKGVPHTSVLLTKKRLHINGAWNHLPRTRENLCRALNLCFEKAVVQPDKRFSVQFSRLDRID